MPGQSLCRLPQQVAQQQSDEHGGQQQPWTGGAQHIAHRHQQAGGKRQRLLKVDKLLDNLRHHRRQQNDDHADRHQGQHDGVNHRLQQPGAQLLALFGIVRQPVQDAVKMAGGFPGGHHGAVQLVETARITAHGFRQRMAFKHLATHARHQGLEMGFFALLRHGIQRFL